MLTDVQVGILSDRRKIPPYGLQGGKPGAMGKNETVTNGRAQRLPSKCTFYAPAGTVLRIETPGGGGWGRAQKKSKKGAEKKKALRRKAAGLSND
jgi:N-methylhydantoinase B